MCWPDGGVAPQVDTDTPRSKEREAPPSEPRGPVVQRPVSCDRAQARAAMGTGDVRIQPSEGITVRLVLR